MLHGCVYSVDRKTYTTLNVWNPTNNRIKYPPNGVGFQPSSWNLCTVTIGDSHVYTVYCCAPVCEIEIDEVPTPYAPSNKSRWTMYYGQCPATTISFRGVRVLTNDARNRMLPWKYLRISPPTHDHAKSSTNWEYWWLCPTGPATTAASG